MVTGVLQERLRRDRFFQLGLVLVTLVVAADALAPWVAPFDPPRGDLRNATSWDPADGSCWAPTPKGGTC